MAGMMENEARDAQEMVGIGGQVDQDDDTGNGWGKSVYS